MRFVNILLKYLGLMTIKRAKIISSQLVAAAAIDVIHRVELGEHKAGKKDNLRNLYIENANEQFDHALNNASTLDSRVEIYNDWEMEKK